MKDGVFIVEMLRKGNEAREKAKKAFTNISLEQLNWKPWEESWSVGQCLDHLIISDCLYFPVFKKIAAGKFEMKFWENWNPLNGFFGKILVSQVQEISRKKLKAPRIFEPSQSNIDMAILERFHKHLDSLLGYIADFSKVDIDKTHITSPVSAVVTLSLRNSITILIQHEHRHINQAIKVMQSKEFPAV
jgi:hypothetical protein